MQLFQGFQIIWRLKFRILTVIPLRDSVTRQPFHKSVQSNRLSTFIGLNMTQNVFSDIVLDNTSGIFTIVIYIEAEISFKENYQCYLVFARDSVTRTFLV